MSQPDRPPSYARFDVPPSDRSERRPTVAHLILAAGILIAAAILLSAVVTSAPPDGVPTDAGPGSTTQIGINR